MLAQTFREFELLVVDDASTDESAAVAASFPDSRVRLFRQEEQHGPAAARNRALAEARGEFIALFDSDDVALPTWLAESMDFLATHADYDIVGAWVETIDEHGAPTGARNAFQDRPEKIPAIMLFTNCLPTSTLLLRRRCLEGRSFDATMPVASDYELWVRLLASHRVAILPKILARYRASSENITSRKRTLAGECLRRIAFLQLDRLGLAPTDAEISLHLRLCRFALGTSKETVLAAEGWLLKLDEANIGTAIYLRAAFARSARQNTGSPPVPRPAVTRSGPGVASNIRLWPDGLRPLHGSVAVSFTFACAAP